MKNFQAKTEDKLRVWANRFDYGLHKTRTLFAKEPSLSNVEKILVIELKRIGDILVSTPTLRTLKRSFPTSNIDVVVLPGMEEVLEGNPNLNRVFSWSRKRLKENYGDYLIDLKRAKYDLAVILHNGTYEVCKLLKEANIPYRIGCTRVGFKEPKGFFLTKQLLPDKKLKHKIEDNLDVLKLINIVPMDDKKPEAYVSKKADRSLNALLKKSGLKPKDKIIIISTVSWTHPTWFKERFAELSDKLIQRSKAKVIFVGTEKEKPFIANVRRLMKKRAYNWAGKTSIQELFSLINKAELVVGIDSSATNIAAAFSTPVITLFGAGDHRIWKPRTEKSIAIQRRHEVCTACMKSKCLFNNHRKLECMKAITVDDVLRAVDKLEIN